MRQWFFIQDGQQQGPVQEQEFVQMFRNARLSSETLVWAEGLAEWTRAGQIKILSQLLSSPPPLPVAPPPMPPATPVPEQQVLLAPQSSGLHAEKAYPVPAAVVYAGFWRRFAAVFIDGMILLIPNMILNLMLSPITGPLLTQIAAWLTSLFGQVPAPFPMREVILLQILNTVASIVPCFYFAAMQSRPRAATVGKMAVGSVVLKENGKPLSFWLAFCREFVKVTLWGFSGGLAMLPAAFTKRKQALHDLIFSTVVVQRASLTGGT